MKFLNSKFVKLFNIVMENMSEEDEEFLDAATDNYLNNISEIDDFKSLDKSETIKNKIKSVVKGSHFLNDNKLINLLTSIGLDTEYHSDIFERVLSMKDRFSNDWTKLIEKGENKLSFEAFKASKNLSSIKNYYKFSDDFMRYLLDFSGKNNGEMGKGEFLLACTINGAYLPTRSNKKEGDNEEIAGDIIINNEKYELKGSHAKIGDTMVQTSLLMKSIISMIKKEIENKKEYLVNKEILPAFYAGKGNPVIICNKQVEYTTKAKGITKTKETNVTLATNFLNVGGMPKIDDLFKEQFKYVELPDGESDEKWWFYIKNNLLKQIFVKIFYTLYGDVGAAVNINQIFYNDATNLNINIEEYKKLIFKTAINWYSNYGSKFKEIIIIDPKGSGTICCISSTEDNYDRYINFFGYPSFGAKEGATRSDACITGPTDVSILRNVK